VFAWWDPGQWVASLPGLLAGRPVCANQPDTPGRIRPTPIGSTCRNYRAAPAPPDLSDGSVKRIPVAGGYYAYVDAADYEELSKYKWHFYSGRYAARHEKKKTILMHRQIMQAPPGMVIDHMSGNGMDNTRLNLRTCSPGENSRNKAKSSGTISRYKGVGWHEPTGKWVARIWYEGRSRSLGYFDDEESAARAYDRRAVECFREFARLNFPDEWPPERRQALYAEHPNGPQWTDGRKTRWEKHKKETRSPSSHEGTKPQRKCNRR
jgi:hypothetical protein